LNPGPLAPKASALPTALHPENTAILQWSRGQDTIRQEFSYAKYNFRSDFRK